MNKKRAAGYTNENLYLILIFLFFTAGSVIARPVFSEILQNDCNIAVCMFIYFLPFTVALVLASSLLGSTLLPLCSMVFGGLCGALAEKAVCIYYAGAMPGVQDLLVNAVAVPAFFIVAVKGMETSALLRTLLDKYSVIVKAAYMRAYIPMTIIVIAAMMTVYFVTA